jgi:acetyl esterase/lipase
LPALLGAEAGWESGMFRLVLCLLLVWLTAGTLFSDAAAQSIDPYPDHSVQFAGGVTGFPDIAYAMWSGYRPLLLDLYLPPLSGKPVPLVLFLHGGSIQGATSRYALGIDDLPSVLASLAARGYAVASVNYRLSAEARFPAQVQDAKAAIRFLRAHAARFHLDPDRAVIWGASSGGQLAALVAASCGKSEFAPPPSNSRPLLKDVAAANIPVSDCVQGAVIWYGDMDISQAAPDPAISAFLGCGPCNAATLASASPITSVSAATPPMLLVDGAADPVSPLAMTAMAGRLRQFNVPVETYIIPDVGHGFIGKTPEITQEANRKALERTFAFLARLFSKSR